MARSILDERQMLARRQKLADDALDAILAENATSSSAEGMSLTRPYIRELQKVLGETSMTLRDADNSMRTGEPRGSSFFGSAKVSAGY